MGVPVDTLRRWLKQDWWPDIARQAEEGQLGRMVGKARRVMDHILTVGVAEDATARDRKQALDAAKFLLERRDNNFREPEKRVAHNHELGLSDQLSQLTVEELRALAKGGAPAPRQLPPAEVFDVDYEEIEQNRPQPGGPVLKQQGDKMVLTVPDEPEFISESGPVRPRDSEGAGT